MASQMWLLLSYDAVTLLVKMPHCDPARFFTVMTLTLANFIVGYSSF